MSSWLLWVEVLDRIGPSCLHVIEGDAGGSRHPDTNFDFTSLRKRFHRTYIANCAYTKVLAEERIAEGDADLVSFGSAFIATPDLVERFRTDAPLNSLDPTTVWSGGGNGYTDYPTLQAAATCPVV